MFYWRKYSKRIAFFSLLIIFEPLEYVLLEKILQAKGFFFSVMIFEPLKYVLLEEIRQKKCFFFSVMIFEPPEQVLLEEIHQKKCFFSSSDDFDPLRCRKYRFLALNPERGIISQKMAVRWLP